MTLPPRRRHLGSTYRLQLNGLGFAGAAKLVPFLDGLGVETCYVSPITRARSGSTHGYDVVDPTVLDPALGTASDLELLLSALDAHSMGLLVDIVPNHMAASAENPFFVDVLRRGLASAYASWFDVAWDEQDGKILLPVLGDPLPAVIERGELSIVTSGDDLAPAIAYFDRRFPIAPETFDRSAPVQELLELQHYRLADWRVANRQVNYRRFFDINELIGVRQEDPGVFAATNQLTVELLADPRVRGVRIDHIDGLRDPAGYLTMLRAATADCEPAPVMVVEKILEGDEELPDWPVEGTTGYEVAATIMGLFVDEYGAAELRVATAGATGDLRTFAERAVDAKRRAIQTLLPHQLDQIVTQLGGTTVGGKAPDVAVAIRELTAYLGVYRTYRQAGCEAAASDVARVDAAARWARRHLGDAAADAVDHVAALLSGDLPADTAAWNATAAWQQFSGPAAAKGVEDTAMYDSGQSLAVADVGSDPDRPAVSVAALHAAMQHRVQHAPLALSSTSTHDSKRSHDVRCRLAVLTEISAEWESAVGELDALVSSSALTPPDDAERRYLYETLVGAWPIDGVADERFADRIRSHVVKAAREAKRHSSWIDPDTEYESRLGQLAGWAIAGEPLARHVVERTVSMIECAGATNGLSSVALKATMPGVPDVYQADDVWSLTLVDPDNRVPLDASRHEQSLASLPDVATGDLLAGWRDGRVKQFVLRRLLETRRASPALFAVGDYQPLTVTGEASDHVLAFARSDGDGWAVVVVPRLVQSLVGPGEFPVDATCWTNTEVVLPLRCVRPLTDVLSQREFAAPAGRLPLSQLFDVLPLAVLVAGN